MRRYMVLLERAAFAHHKPGSPLVFAQGRDFFERGPQHDAPARLFKSVAAARRAITKHHKGQRLFHIMQYRIVPVEVKP